MKELAAFSLLLAAAPAAAQGAAVPAEAVQVATAAAGQLPPLSRILADLNSLMPGYGDALGTLAAFRKELRAWYAAHGGKYPASPAELAPGPLRSAPRLCLPDHEPTAEVTVIDSGDLDKDIYKAVKDSGGWLYFAAPGSDNYGLLLIDCGHRRPAGEEFYKY